MLLVVLMVVVIIVLVVVVMVDFFVNFIGFVLAGMRLYSGLKVAVSGGLSTLSMSSKSSYSSSKYAVILF